MKPVISI